MQAAAVPMACFLSLIRPPGIQFESALLQIAPVDKGKCPFVRDSHDLVFQLYTRHNPTVAHNLRIDDDESLFASSIDFHDPTVIYFHAFMETPDDGSALAVREAYTHRGDTNVIVVDAQRLEAGPWYFKAAENTWYIGRIAAQFIDYLVSRGLKLSKTHLVGHSLGAQAAGVAGGSLQSGLVARITGLDPALPLFDKLSPSQRLDPSDAEFVDVIHTDAGIFGYKQQVGHVDFYPNGGISPQPGCELEVVIPKQLVLNKCNSDSETIGLLEFGLQENLPNMKTNKNKMPATARNTIITSQTIERNNILNENGYTKNYGPLKICNIITDRTSKNILNGPKRRNIAPTQSTIRFMTKAQIVYKEKLTKVFSKYTTKKSRSYKNQNINKILKRPESKINLTNQKQHSIPLLKRPQTIENEKFKNFGKFKSQKTFKRTERPESKVKLSNQQHLLTRPQILENDESNKNFGKFKSRKFFKRPESKVKLSNQKHLIPLLKSSQTIENDEFNRNFENFRTQKISKRTKRSESKIEVPILFLHHDRQRRFIPFFKKPLNNENILLKILDFLIKNHQRIGPTISIIREISTVIKTPNGEIQNFIKEQNNNINAEIRPAPSTYNIQIANESKIKTILRKLFGLGQGNKLVVTASS